MKNARVVFASLLILMSFTVLLGARRNHRRFGSEKQPIQTTQPAQTTPAQPVTPVTFTINAGGTINILLNGKTVASGMPWLLTLTPTSTVGVMQSATHGVITQLYAAVNVSAVFDVTVSGYDLTVSTHITNAGIAATAPITVCYPTFTFSGNPTGTMQSWHWSYLAAEGTSIYHPSFASPIGCVTAGDANYTLAAWSPSEISRPSLLQAHFVSNDAPLPNPLMPELDTVDTVAVGASIDISAVLRVTTDTSMDGLLGGYKLLLPAMSYTPVNKGAIAAQSVDSTWITPSNPLGYNLPFRRIDIPQGVQMYLATELPNLKTMNGLGVIFWGPGGYQTTSFYPVDYDVNLNRIAGTWPSVVSGFKNAGYRVGICARMGDTLNADGSTRRADPTNSADVATMLTRVDNVANTGVDVWYVDSACNDPASTTMVQIAKKHLGNSHLFYCEYANDISLSFSGAYCEWMGTRTRNLTETQRAQLLYFYPESSWLCMDRTNTLTAAQLNALGLQQLTGD